MSERGRSNTDVAADAAGLMASTALALVASCNGWLILTFWGFIGVGWFVRGLI